MKFRLAKRFGMMPIATVRVPATITRERIICAVALYLDSQVPVCSRRRIDDAVRDYVYSGWMVRTDDVKDAMGSRDDAKESLMVEAARIVDHFYPEATPGTIEGR